MASKSLIIEQLRYIWIYEELYGCGYEQIDGEYSHIGGIMASVAVKYPYGKSYNVYYEIDQA